MTRRTFVLDTNALLDRDFMHKLRSYSGRKILPAVAYAELGLRWELSGRLSVLHGTLATHGIEIEWFRRQEADQAIRTGVQVGDFAENARDHLIAAHAAQPDRILVTNDTKDFTFVENKKRTTEVFPVT